MPDRTSNRKLKKPGVAYKRYLHALLLLLLCLFTISVAVLLSFHLFKDVIQPPVSASLIATPQSHLFQENTLTPSRITPSVLFPDVQGETSVLSLPPSSFLMPDPASTLALPTPDIFSSEVRATTYVVQPGDTLSRIAQHFDLLQTTLATVNQLVGSHTIQIGQVLKIPPADVSSISIPVKPRLDNSGFHYENVVDLPGHNLNYQVLGFSTLGWSIESYRIGSGPIRVAFIGGTHGGYEWNTTVLAYEILDYLLEHPEQVPNSISLYIIPSANPDGQVAVVGRAGRFYSNEVPAETTHGRFNGNGVDLNRNWDCEWSPTGFWRQQPVSAGYAPFSEIETQILKEFLANPKMDAVIFWHSAMPGVFPGGCGQPFPPANSLGLVYAQAAPYPFFDNFTSYQVTGDASDWLSIQGIPAISVEINNHTNIDWEQNLSGVLAVLNFLDSQPR